MTKKQVHAALGWFAAALLYAALGLLLWAEITP
jgi:hypothetical protein